MENTKRNGKEHVLPDALVIVQHYKRCLCRDLEPACLAIVANIMCHGSHNCGQRFDCFEMSHGSVLQLHEVFHSIDHIRAMHGIVVRIALI